MLAQRVRSPLGGLRCVGGLSFIQPPPLQRASMPAFRWAMPRTSIRWIVYGVVLALALIGIRVADRPDGRAALPPAPARVQAREGAVARVPQLPLARPGQPPRPRPRGPRPAKAP